MASLNVPPEMAALRPMLGTIVAGIEQRAPYGAVLLSTQDGLQISVDNREQSVTQRVPASGTVITAYDGQTIFEKAIGGFDRAIIERGAHELVQGITFARPGGVVVDPGAARSGDFSVSNGGSVENLSVQDKLERLRALHQRLQGRDSRIVNVRVGYSEMNDSTVFRNRSADLAQNIQRQRLSVVVMAAGPDGVRYDYLSKSTLKSWSELEYSDEELQSVVDNAIALLSAERIEPGEYTIITGPGVSGTICHESFGHGVETDMFLKERAKAAHFIDKVVASPVVNIWDDPTQAVSGAVGLYFFDDEGMLASPAQIVENGVFRRGITDLYSATALGLARTANGRRQDYSRKAYARMSNTYFGRGTTPVADLFAQVDDGIYLEKWSSGMEDPQGWGIQVTCQFGQEIKHGKFTGRMFAPVGISGYLPDVMQSISGVSDVWSLDPGMCGKGHKEFVPVSSGGPHLLMKARLG